MAPIPAITAELPNASIVEFSPKEGDRYEYVEDTNEMFDALADLARVSDAFSSELAARVAAINASAIGGGVALIIDAQEAVPGSIEYLNIITAAPATVTDVTEKRKLLLFNLAGTVAVHSFIAETGPDGVRWSGPLASSLTANISDAVEVEPEPEIGPQLVSGPTITRTDALVTVQWTMDRLTTRQVEYGATAQLGSLSTGTVSSDSTAHSDTFTFAGDYIYYRVRSIGENTAEYIGTIREHRFAVAYSVAQPSNLNFVRSDSTSGELFWTAAASDRIVRYELRIDGVLQTLSDPRATSKFLATLLASTVYSASLQSVDFAGIKSNPITLDFDTDV